MSSHHACVTPAERGGGGGGGGGGSVRFFPGTIPMDPSHYCIQGKNDAMLTVRPLIIGVRALQGHAASYLADRERGGKIGGVQLARAQPPLSTKYKQWLFLAW